MKNRISGGIYLVLDPAMQEPELLGRLEKVLGNNEIAAVQVWDNFPPSVDTKDLIQKICHLCHKSNVPLLINNKWELARTTDADGIHLDEVPENIEEVKAVLDQDAIIGITCNNDLSVVKWADENKLDYISFCSVFTSSTSNSCELVDFEMIRKARKITSAAIFLAGGINSRNIHDLKGLDFDGIAVISGIMGSENPDTATKEYQTALKRLQK